MALQLCPRLCIFENTPTKKTTKIIEGNLAGFTEQVALSRGEAWVGFQ